MITTDRKVPGVNYSRKSKFDISFSELPSAEFIKRIKNGAEDEDDVMPTSDIPLDKLEEFSKNCQSIIDLRPENGQHIIDFLEKSIEFIKNLPNNDKICLDKYTSILDECCTDALVYGFIESDKVYDKRIAKEETKMIALNEKKRKEQEKKDKALIEELSKKYNFTIVKGE